MDVKAGQLTGSGVYIGHDVEGGQVCVSYCELTLVRLSWMLSVYLCLICVF